MKSNRADSSRGASRATRWHAHVCPDCDRVWRCTCGDGWRIGYMTDGCVVHTWCDGAGCGGECGMHESPLRERV